MTGRPIAAVNHELRISSVTTQSLLVAATVDLVWWHCIHVSSASTYINHTVPAPCWRLDHTSDGNNARAYIRWDWPKSIVSLV